MGCGTSTDVSPSTYCAETKSQPARGALRKGTPRSLRSTERGVSAPTTKNAPSSGATPRSPVTPRSTPSPRFVHVYLTSGAVSAPEKPIDHMPVRYALPGQYMPEPAPAVNAKCPQQEKFPAESVISAPKDMLLWSPALVDELAIDSPPTGHYIDGSEDKAMASRQQESPSSIVSPARGAAFSRIDEGRESAASSLVLTAPGHSGKPAHSPSGPAARHFRCISSGDAEADFAVRRLQKSAPMPLEPPKNIDIITE